YPPPSRFAFTRAARMRIAFHDLRDQAGDLAAALQILRHCPCPRAGAGGAAHRTSAIVRLAVRCIGIRGPARERARGVVRPFDPTHLPTPAGDEEHSVRMSIA